MSGNGARIGRAEKALDGDEDPHDALVRFVRWWNSVRARGDPAAAVFVAHAIRAPAARGRRRLATEPADPAASAASFQAMMDDVTDEEFAARQTVEMQRLFDAHERGECHDPDCRFGAPDH